MDEVFGDLILCGVHNKQHTVCFVGVPRDFSWKCVSIATALFRDLLHRNHIANMAVMLRCSVPQKTGRDIDRQSQRAKKKKSLHSQAESSQCWCCKSAAISKFPALFPITVLTETVKVLRSRCWKNSQTSAETHLTLPSASAHLSMDVVLPMVSCWQAGLLFN